MEGKDRYVIFFKIRGKGAVSGTHCPEKGMAESLMMLCPVENWRNPWRRRQKKENCSSFSHTKGTGQSLHVKEEKKGDDFYFNWGEDGLGRGFRQKRE